MELQGQPGVELPPWGDGGEWGWELGRMDPCPVCWWLCSRGEDHIVPQWVGDGCSAAVCL